LEESAEFCCCALGELFAAGTRARSLRATAEEGDVTPDVVVLVGVSMPTLVGAAAEARGALFDATLGGVTAGGSNKTV